MGETYEGSEPVAFELSSCRLCGGGVGWVDCPTGGWWAHEVHPFDDHDAQPVNEVAAG